MLLHFSVVQDGTVAHALQMHIGAVLIFDTWSMLCHVLVGEVSCFPIVHGFHTFSFAQTELTRAVLRPSSCVRCSLLITFTYNLWAHIQWGHSWRAFDRLRNLRSFPVEQLLLQQCSESLWLNHLQGLDGRILPQSRGVRGQMLLFPALVMIVVPQSV